jgi:GWxTD domain-containing protein
MTTKKTFQAFIRAGKGGLWLLALAATLSACASRKKAAKGNTPVLYNPATSTLHPRLDVYHQSAEQSQCLVMLSADELIVSEANKEAKPQAYVKIHYDLFDCTDMENNQIINDSATFVNFVPVSPQQKTLVFPIPIAAKEGRRYMLSLQMTDLIRRNTVREYISVDKTSEMTAQNFMVSTINGAPHMLNTVAGNELLHIKYERKPINKLFIKYMAAAAPVATSPLSVVASPEVAFKADTVWEQPYDPTTNFRFGEEGYYLVQTDTLQPQGLLLMNFGTAFPRENRTEQLVQPLRYFLNDAQWQRLMASGDSIPKKMIDDFWLACTGSTDKARMLIRVFYTRMAYANMYFTDVKEGWKTDRGEVFMVYGLPDKVMKSSDTEVWQYNRGQDMPVTFTFDRSPSPYSDDHYTLRRGDPQSTYWARALDTWRGGQVFVLSEMDNDE